MASAIRKERSNEAMGSFPSFPLENRCLPEADAPKPCPKGTRSPEASSPELFTSKACSPKAFTPAVGAVETSDPATGIFLFCPSCSAMLSLPFPLCISFYIVLWRKPIFHKYSFITNLCYWPNCSNFSAFEA